MSAFSIILIVVIVLVVAWLILMGRSDSHASMTMLGLKSPNEIEENKSALEAEDLQQMLEARNARRRARGESEVSADQYEMQVMAEVHAQRRRDEAALDASRGKAEADAEIEELLEATNARRRRRGLPERTREDVEREFGG